MSTSHEKREKDEHGHDCAVIEVACRLDMSPAQVRYWMQVAERYDDGE